MSQSESRHRAAWLAVAVFAGLPLAASAAPALAGPGVAGSPGAEPAGGVAVVSGVADSPVESGRQVVFRGGGVLGVSCGANPDTTSVSVPAESTLRVVNRTGHRATLLLDGTARGEIGKGSTAEVLFHRGPVALKIKPHCVLSEESAAVRVRVQARQTTPPPPQAVPSTPTAPAPDPAPPAAPPTRPGTSAPGGGPAPAPAAPDGRRTAAPGAVAPGATAAPRGRTPAPTASPDDDGGPSTAPDAGGPADVELTDPAPPAPELAAEPLSSVEPLTERGPVGLLAAIATICVLGVSTGAIRVILSQRARRASLA